MAFKNTLQGTYDKVTGQAPYANALSIQAIVISNNRRFVAQKVIAYDVFESYIDKYASERFLTALFDLVTLRDHILPNIDSLYIELNITSRDKRTSKNIGKTRKKKFQAFAIDPPKLEMNKDDSATGMRTTEQMAGFVEMDFQLVEIPVMYLRLYEYSGIHPDLSPGDFLRYAFNEAMNDVMKKVMPDVEPRVEVYKASNNALSSNIIKNRRKLMDLPKYVQDKTGVYSAGIGRFYKNEVMYIYPLFNPNRFEKTKSRLNIVSLPNDRMPAPEQTYMSNGKEITIISSGVVNVFNKSEHSARNTGTGVRYTRASSLVDGMASAKDNKAVSNFTDSNVAKAVEAKPDGLTSSVPTVITDNPFRELSKLAQGLGFNIGISWGNSNEALIYPAMPVRFTYNDDDEIVSYMGCVTGITTSYRPGSNMFNDRTIIRNSKLTLFVKK